MKLNKSLVLGTLVVSTFAISGLFINFSPIGKPSPSWKTIGQYKRLSSGSVSNPYGGSGSQLAQFEMYKQPDFKNCDYRLVINSPVVVGVGYTDAKIVRYVPVQEYSKTQIPLYNNSGYGEATEFNFDLTYSISRGAFIAQSLEQIMSQLGPEVVNFDSLRFKLTQHAGSNVAQVLAFYKYQDNAGMLVHPQLHASFKFAIQEQCVFDSKTQVIVDSLPNEQAI